MPTLSNRQRKLAKKRTPKPARVAAPAVEAVRPTGERQPAVADQAFFGERAALLAKVEAAVQDELRRAVREEAALAAAEGRPPARVLATRAEVWRAIERAAEAGCWPRLMVCREDRLAAARKAAAKAFAREHGLEVSTDSKTPGRMRLRSRDGLATLAAAASITDAERRAGMAYRLCFEAAAAGLRSGLANAGEGGGSAKAPAFGRDAAALHRAYVMARLAQMERAVGACMVDGRELLVLRAVAGEGRTIASLGGTSGHARAANLAALRRALAAVARVLPLRSGRGGLRITGR